MFSTEIFSNMSVFELIMIVAFGSAWPLSIYKSIKSKTTKGKSLFFLIIVFLGYLSGILHKILFNMDFVIIFYILNLLMVFIDIMLYFRNSYIDKKALDEI